MRIADWVFGLILVIGAGIIFQQAAGFPAMPGQNYGPALVPSIVATGFMLCGLSLLWSGLRERAPALALDPEARVPGRLFDWFLTIGMVIFTILVWDVLGFLITSTIALTALVARYRHGHFLTSLLTGVIGSLVIDWMFRRLLLVPLPLGPLASWMW